MELIKLVLRSKDDVKNFFSDVFTKELWNDDWSNEEQLENYIIDLIGNRNSLTLGYFDGDKLAALSMGHVKHWYSATEYYIDDGIC